MRYLGSEKIELMLNDKSIILNIDEIDDLISELLSNEITREKVLKEFMNQILVLINNNSTPRFSTKKIDLENE